MTVCLDETVTITETTFKISLETYNEIQEIAEEFEVSLRRALVQHFLQMTTMKMTTKRQP